MTEEEDKSQPVGADDIAVAISRPMPSYLAEAQTLLSDISGLSRAEVRHLMTLLFTLKAKAQMALDQEFREFTTAVLEKEVKKKKGAK